MSLIPFLHLFFACSVVNTVPKNIMSIEDETLRTQVVNDQLAKIDMSFELRQDTPVIIHEGQIFADEDVFFDVPTELSDESDLFALLDSDMTGALSLRAERWEDVSLHAERIQDDELALFAIHDFPDSVYFEELSENILMTVDTSIPTSVVMAQMILLSGQNLDSVYVPLRAERFSALMLAAVDFAAAYDVEYFDAFGERL